MLLQRGKFLINKISELDNIEQGKDGIKRIIDLNYMGQFEYEGNAVPISRMFIEYYRCEYEYYPLDIYNKNNEQMYFYFNKTLLENKSKDYLYNVATEIINREFFLYDYIYGKLNLDSNDFWWDLNGDYFIFFGKEKKEVINYFIESCYKRDGEKEKIKQKLMNAGYKME